MANPLRGEIDFAAGGTECKLRLDIDAICNIEAGLDLGFGEIVDRVLRRGAANYRIARALLIASSQGKIDGEKASALIANHVVSIWPQMVQLVAAALPPAQEAGDADPPKAAAAAAPSGDGTGPTS